MGSSGINAEYMGQSRETTELQWRFSLFFCWQWLPRLPPRQTPRLRLTLTSFTEDTEDMVLATEAMDMVSATDMEAMDTTTARGRPRLSPRLRLTLTSCTVDTTDMASATAMASAMEVTGMEAMDITTARGRLTPLWSLPLSATLRCLPLCCPCRGPSHPVHHLQDLHPHRGDQRCCYQRCRPRCRRRLQGCCR